MRLYKIHIPAFEIECEGLAELEQILKTMDIRDKLRVLDEYLLICMDCKTNKVKPHEYRCESCFNIWLNRKQAPSDEDLIK